jgi:predicted aminopeptidase
MRLSVIATIVAALGLASCAPVHYLTQAAVGQEDINRRGIAIAEIVEGEHLDVKTRQLLAHVAPIKAFGERHGLRHTKNYERYVWLPRSAVVWVVSACHPLAFRPKTWSFPVVGSFTYRGWFDREEAKREGAALAAQGWDVDVRPSPAYSTLGWFDDPILSTMLSTGDEAVGDLADVILHETLHATFYVPGQSTLNESMASFVGDTLAVRYVEETFGPDSVEKRAFLELRARGEKRGKRMKEAYDALEALYASRASTEEKLAEKQRITDALKRDLDMKRPVTNASLIQYKTYGSGKEEMAALYRECGEDLPRMLRALEGVREGAAKARPHSDPALLLRPLLGRGCT